MLRMLFHRLTLAIDRLLTPSTLLIGSAGGFFVTCGMVMYRPLSPKELTVATMLATAMIVVFAVLAIAELIRTESAEIALRLHTLEVHFQVTEAMENIRTLQRAVRSVHGKEPGVYELPDPDGAVESSDELEDAPDATDHERLRVGGTA